MKDLFDNGRRQDGPFLAPLGTRREPRQRLRDMIERMPSAAAPIAFTLVGGLALIVVLGTILAGGEDRIPRQAQHEQPGTAVTEAAPPADTAPASEPAPPTVATATPLLRAPESPPDPASTASILTAAPHPSVFAPNVAVAETEDDIATLEAIQRQEVEADIGTPSQESTASIDPTPPMRAAVTTSYVNMRAGEGDDAEVLEVVPAQAQIQAEEGCDWCSVVYDGRSGYIYRTFIDYR